MADFFWGPNGQRISATQADRNRKTADALRSRVQNPDTYWEGLQSIVGDVGGSLLDWQADEAQEAGRKEVEDALKAAQAGADPDAYLSVLGNEWASPSQSAVASALLNRGWSLDDRKSDREYERSLLDLKRGWELDDVQSDRDYNEPLRDLQIEGAELGNETAQFGLDQAKEGFRTLVTPEERAQYGIQPDDKTPWQLGPDGRLYDLGGKGGGVTINTGDSAGAEFYKAGDKTRGEDMAAIEKAGYQAQTKLGMVDRLEALLEKAPQGLEGGWKQFAGEFGIATEGLDNIQSAQALINKLVPEQRTPGSGPMSDADLALFKQSMPRIMNQPGGNKLIIETLRGIAAYEATMGEIATRALNREITPAAARAEMAAVANPLEHFRDKDGEKTSPEASSTAAPVKISSDAEFDALPPGTLFIGPDDVTRRKP